MLKQLAHVNIGLGDLTLQWSRSPVPQKPQAGYPPRQRTVVSSTGPPQALQCAGRPERLRVSGSTTLPDTGFRSEAVSG